MGLFSKLTPAEAGEAAVTAAEPAFWCHVCMRTVPASQAATHQHDPGADGPR